MWNDGIYFIAEIQWKTASSQNFTEIGQSAAELWPQPIFNMAAVRHLEFEKKSYLVIYLSSSSKSAYVCQISSISDDFSFKYGDFTICNMAAIRHLEFSKFCAFLTWPLSPCYSASLCKISLKPDNRLLSYGKKTIFKIRLSAILNFMLSFLSRVSIWRAILI